MFAMFELMLAETFLNAAILCTILYVVAKHEADFSFAKVAMVVAGIQLASFLAQVFLNTVAWFTLLISFVFTLLFVQKFCWLSFKKTLVVVLIFCVFQAGTKVGFNAIAAQFTPQPVQPPDSELGEVVKMINAQVADAGDTRPKKPLVKESGTDTAQWKEARQALKIGGVMLNADGSYVAIVNGDIVEVGDPVKLEHGKLRYRWKVTTISRHDVDLEPLDVQPK